MSLNPLLILSYGNGPKRGYVTRLRSREAIERMWVLRRVVDAIGPVTRNYLGRAPLPRVSPTARAAPTRGQWTPC